MVSVLITDAITRIHASGGTARTVATKGITGAEWQSLGSVSSLMYNGTQWHLSVHLHFC